MILPTALILFISFFVLTSAGTSISVQNQYKKELNIKIQGAGVGGCDIVMNPSSNNTNDCWCLWGTLNYSFCAYTKLGDEKQDLEQEKNHPAVKSGRCPIITGESLLCSDLSSLGNCYNGAYSCTVDTNGFCDCITV